MQKHLILIHFAVQRTDTEQQQQIKKFSRKDGKEGVVYLVINNSLTEATTVELPKSAERSTLAGEGGTVRAAVMTLNGKPLVLGAGNSLPELTPAAQEAGTVTLAPATCTFFVL